MASLTSLEDWRCSCLCSELTPLVAERSALFVKEQKIPIDGAQLVMFFQPELGSSVLELLGRSAVSGRQAPLQKQERKGIDGGSLVASPMPKSVLFCGREDQLLRE